jgi:hypothetical protein
MKLKVEKSNKGYPCLWEKGGGMTNTGYALLVANADGTKKQALHIRKGGHLSCGEHALVPISIGDIVLEVGEHRGTYEMSIYRILSIEGLYADAELLYDYKKGEWNIEPIEDYNELIDAGQKKASDYHCRTAYFVVEPKYKKRA